MASDDKLIPSVPTMLGIDGDVSEEELAKHPRLKFLREPGLWYPAKKVDAALANLREELDEAIKREMDTVMRLEMAESSLQLANAKLAEALEQLNDTRRDLCEMVEAEFHGWDGDSTEQYKRNYAESKWPGSAAELWPESEKK
jgi:hypothetical protein